MFQLNCDTQFLNIFLIDAELWLRLPKTPPPLQRTWPCFLFVYLLAVAGFATYLPLQRFHNEVKRLYIAWQAGLVERIPVVPLRMIGTPCYTGWISKSRQIIPPTSTVLRNHSQHEFSRWMVMISPMVVSQSHEQSKQWLNLVINSIVVGSINIHVPKACNDISLKGSLQWNFSHLLMSPFQVLLTIVLKDLR